MKVRMCCDNSVMYGVDGAKVESKVLEGFVRSAIGFEDSEYVGRLQTLELTTYPTKRKSSKHGISVNFGCLCTLLPFSRTLEELRVWIDSHSDFLWLTFAMIHPRIKQTRWRRLLINSNTRISGINVKAIAELIHSKDRATTLKLILDTESSYDPSVYNARQESEVGFVYRTADISKRTKVLSSDRTRTLTTLTRGALVELCCAPEVSSAEGFLAAIVVPGYGFGWVPSSSLRNVLCLEGESPPLPCLNALHVRGGLSAQISLPDFWCLFGAQLEHVRVAMPISLMVYLPRIQTLDLVENRQHDAIPDLSVLPNLRSLGLACFNGAMDACIMLLTSRTLMRRLTELRIHLALTTAATDEFVTRTVPLLLNSYSSLTQLVIIAQPWGLHHSKSVMTDRFGVAVEKMNELYDSETMMVNHNGAAMSAAAMHHRKMTFLSSIRELHASAHASLDTNMLKIIFSFCGTQAREIHFIPREFPVLKLKTLDIQRVAIHVADAQASLPRLCGLQPSRCGSRTRRKKEEIPSLSMYYLSSSYHLDGALFP